jgi:ABC-type transport system involved in multi-copper enzyme maturation permease subunit
MRALVWKECRLNALVLSLGATLWIAPYLIAALTILITGSGGRVLPEVWARSLEPASVVSLEGSLLTLLLLGANAIARERSDRSAEFLAYLPPSRAKVLASKAVLPLATALMIWTTDLLTAYVVAPALSREAARGLGPVPWWAIASAGVLLFGAAWLGSSVLDSPLVALGFALLAGGLVALFFAATNGFFGWPVARLGPEAATRYYATGSAAVGVLCFLGGSVSFLKRTEP